MNSPAQSTHTDQHSAPNTQGFFIPQKEENKGGESMAKTGKPDNLKPFGGDALTVEQQREIQRKGGRASVEAKRRKKTLRETAEIMLQTELPDDVKAKLKEKGIDAADYSDAVIAYAIQSVMRGNSNMFGQLLKLMGEGSERIEVQNMNDDSAAALDALFKENERTNSQSDQ